MPNMRDADRPIILGRTTAETDHDEYEEQHMIAHGHWPIPDLRRGRYCGHPVHDFLQAIMEAPGVDIEIPFVSQEVINDDEAMMVDAEQRYHATVDRYRDHIQGIEDDIEREKNPPPKKVF